MQIDDFHFIDFKKFYQLTGQLVDALKQQYPAAKTEQPSATGKPLAASQPQTKAKAKAPAVIQPPTNFDMVIAINRGGAVLARFLSDFLMIKMGSFAMSSYVGVNQQKELIITQELNLELKDKRILLVDEICDTGKTFLKALEHLKPLQAKSVVTASLVHKPHAVYQPDCSVETTTKWVVFPYEKMETLKAISQESTQLQKTVRDFFQHLS